MNVTAADIAQSGVHGHNVRIPQQQFASLRQYCFSGLGKNRARRCGYAENSNKMSSIHRANDYSGQGFGSKKLTESQRSSKGGKDMKSALRPFFAVLSILLLASVSTGSPRQEPLYELASFGVFEWGVEDLIGQLEQDWVTAIVHKDTDMLNRIMADDFTAISPNGQRYTKFEAIADIGSGRYAVESMNLRNINVRVFGDTAIVTVYQNEKSKFGDEDCSGQYAFTDVWLFRDGLWQAVASQGTPLSLP
jgi:ketosteroid isomerase-like protein